jgi:hypothetical protein
MAAAAEKETPAKRKPTPASAFRQVREKGELITCPTTDRTVIMRTVTPEHLLALGDIPEILADLAIKILYGAISEKEYSEFHEIGERAERALDYAKSLKVVLMAALIYPLIVDNPESDAEITFDDLERGEKRWFFDLALIDASRLTLFRMQQEGNVETVGQGQGTAPATEPVAGGQE